ncbi:hypothetical protein [Nocardia altamirensis]|uniref:hypothetical protein n=1 Tax=Nocardia altamirensis TaxID=472158 RepID=UPI00084086C5|nr:hypothetical protein [Nocardia altamirensis]
MQSDEFMAMVRAYLNHAARNGSASPDDVVAGAKGVILRGGDPIRLTFQLDEYASSLGQIDTIKDLRRRIGAVWNDLD